MYQELCILTEFIMCQIKQEKSNFHKCILAAQMSRYKMHSILYFKGKGKKNLPLYSFSSASCCTLYFFFSPYSYYSLSCRDFTANVFILAIYAHNQ